MSAIVFKDCGHSSPESVFNASASLYPAGTLLAISYVLDCFWLPDSNDNVKLTAVYEIAASDRKGVRFLVAPTSVTDRLSQHSHGDIVALSQHLGLPCFASEQALPLQPVRIPKPWGEEIWYTGMEQRGLARIGEEDSAQPLPWVVSALPDRLCAGRLRDLILLKILAPLPDEVYGDLYLELHREKREVYVVTHIDPRAWPNGKGAIRLGFSTSKRKAYASDEAFRSAFADAVKAYERLRRQIDARLDDLRRAEGYALEDPVAPEQMNTWLATLPEELREREARLRADMESFTRLQPLQVGDVVKVPTLTPHSLQHGVRTVEFQTPVYERLIVSFAQKVLTQQHWDTEAAVSEMLIDTPPQEDHLTIRKNEYFKEEMIVSFDDFEVFRVTVEKGGSAPMPATSAYRLIIAVRGQLALDRLQLSPERAALIPPGCEFLIHNESESSLIFLWAMPRASSVA